MCMTAQIRYDLRRRDTLLHRGFDVLSIQLADHQVRVSNPDIHKEVQDGYF